MMEMRLKQIHVYELIAFATGFALMAHELVASRILAPMVGSSIYVWTSVIGVIIAALSLGYTVGGVVADRRVRPLDVSWLLLVSSLTVLLTLINADATLGTVVVLIRDPRFQGLVASALLFLPTSFLIGMTSPYLARLRNLSVDTTGTAVASLGAMNSIGGIVGTFCTGFIFFGYIGSRETLLLVSLVLLATSWLIEPRRQWSRRLAATVVVAVVAVAPFVVGMHQPVVHIDTPASSYLVANFKYNHRTIRSLVTGPGALQSGIYTDGSNELVFAYTRKMAELVAAAPGRSRILILGGGAFTLPQYLAQRYPNSQIDVVEIDPQLVAISRQYFGYRDPVNVRVHAEDARTFLNRNQGKYDIALVDVYNDAIPFSLTTQEYAEKLRRSVKTDGVVLANIIGADNGGCRDMLAGLNTSYRSQFAYTWAYPMVASTLHGRQNIVLAASAQSSDWLPESGRVAVNLPSLILTDDFAPIERLRQRCQAGVL